LQRFEKAGNSGRVFRPAPFWSWNDELKADEVRRQIREMSRGGFGGHFMHSRIGLATPYLGTEWMECVVAACMEARDTNVQPWLYDEDCWPSGNCGRRITHGRPENQAKILVYEMVRPANFRVEPQTIAVFIGQKTGDGPLSDFQRLPDVNEARSLRLKGSEVMLHFAYRNHEYVDVLNRAATGQFIESTHEEYRRAAGRFFGTTVPGIFTDEPMIMNERPGAAWSLELPEFFRRSAGYDLLDHLPALFFSVPGGQKVRFDYHQTLLRLFLLAFTLPLYQWCGRNKLMLTGHLMGEDSCLAQVQFAAAVMPHYEYMHVPGVDHLRRWITSPVGPKQASSVANQFGRSRVLSEIWGASGHGVTFEQLRWIADWQMVFGVNFLCPHLSLYSMRGCRKRDYPPNLFFQQPYWPHFKRLSDTLSRTAAVASAGTLVADCLVVHPVTSAWVLHGDPAAREDLSRIDDDLARLTTELAAMHCDFEFGDETIMERHGRVTGGKLVISRRKYSKVIVPSCTNLKSGTFDLLKRLTRSRGTLVFAGRLPTLVDGQPSKPLEQFIARQKCLDASTVKGAAALKKILKPTLRISAARGTADARDVAAMWRDDGRQHMFFLVNLDPAKGHEIAVTMPIKGLVQQLDATTGQVAPLEARAARGGQTVRLQLPEMGSTLLVVNKNRKPAKAPAAVARVRRKKVLARRWQYKRLDPNALVLDVARAAFGEQPPGDPLPVSDIQKMLLAAGHDTVVEMTFAFASKLDTKRSRRLQLAIERPNDFEIHVNGLRVPLRDEGPWIDPSLRLLDISRLLNRGANVITLRRPFFQRDDHRRRLVGLNDPSGGQTFNNWIYPQVELESIYLVGDFAVEFDGSQLSGDIGFFGRDVKPWDRLPPGRSAWLCGNPVLVPDVESGSGQDLLRGGLPFYAGTVELSQTLVLTGTPSPASVLELAPPEAVVTQVLVNGHECEPLWQRPYRVEVGPHLVKGKNDITLRLTGSLRNLMGPHHHRAGELYMAGPNQFVGRKRFHRGHLVDNHEYREDYNLVPFGLGGDVVLHY
ncbi:MAG: hypothetical protein JXL80_00530, partial [Planctomycetes bacterium]|nr:hypothetical protein [Planctomycetota bacterium]